MSRRYPGPLYVTLTPFTTQHRSHVQLSLLRLFHTLLATGFPVTPPEPGPAPPPATGFRPSGLPTPVSPGVPTGARNLGVCVFSCFALTLCYCLSVFSLSISLFTSVTALWSFTCRLTLNLCYRSLVPSQSAFHTPPRYRPPTFVYPHFSRTLVFP